MVQDGLVYVVDIDLGLFVLRYTGKHAAEVGRAAFVEGNSSPSRYTAKAPVIRRPAALAVRPPVVVHDPTPLQLPTGHTDRHWTWVC